MYPPDKWKEKNQKQFRAFELHRFRISYKVTNDEIIIARFRHASQQPESY
ncbi:type II toxin-antitoxin system RelE/ParE family toxin [Flavisolibacter sp. BT320]|nr:type II toxin-antitoxin system RelE/ParE family toxin [Flavisolibacter longurius]